MGKYEEALERARQGLPMDQVFPELSMSEDERIRKDIIHFILYKVGNRLDEETEHKFITWLEKQKEPLTPEERMNHPLYLEGFDVGRQVGEAVSQPAEWSEEDEKMRSNLMSLLANMRGDRITEETYQKYYPWLKALRPSWKPSEEHPEGGCSEKPNDLLLEQEPTCKTCDYYENDCPFTRGKLMVYPNKVCKDYTHSAMKQEQLGADIKKELHAYICSDEYMNTREDGSLLIARHFYELGLNAREKENVSIDKIEAL